MNKIIASLLLFWGTLVYGVQIADFEILSLNPVEVQAGTQAIEFEFQIVPTDGGNYDTIEIQSPFQNQVTLVEFEDYVLEYSTVRPLTLDTLSWYSYNNSIILLFAESSLSGDTQISFETNIATLTSVYHFSVSVDEITSELEPEIQHDSLDFEVLPGGIYSFRLTESGVTFNASSIIAGTPTSLEISAFDVYQNDITPQSVLWEFNGLSNYFSPNNNSVTTFTPTNAIVTQIEVTVDGEVYTSHEIEIMPANLDRIVISNQLISYIPMNNFQMTTDDVVACYAHGFDGYNNYIGLVDCSWDSDNDEFDNQIVGNGNSCIIEPNLIGSFILSCSSTIGGFSDITGLISVLMGEVVGLSAFESDGTSLLLSPFILGDQLHFVIKSYDADSNYSAGINNINLSFFDVTYEGILPFIDGDGYTISFNESGNAGLLIEYIPDNSISLYLNPIPVDVGSVETLLITDIEGGSTPISDQEIVAGTSHQLWATGLNLNMFNIGSVLAEWIIESPTRELTIVEGTHCEFVPELEGVYTITAISNGLSDEVEFTCTPAELFEVKICDVFGVEFISTNIIAGDNGNFICKGFDEYGNEVSDDEFNSHEYDWQFVSNPSNIISLLNDDPPLFVFESLDVGSGYVNLGVDNNLSSDVTGTINILPGNLLSLCISEIEDSDIEILDQDIEAGTSFQLWATAINQNGINLGSIEVEWNIESPTRELTIIYGSNCEFLPTIVGNHIITISRDGFTDTVVFNCVSTNPDVVEICDPFGIEYLSGTYIAGNSYFVQCRVYDRFMNEILGNGLSGITYNWEFVSYTEDMITFSQHDENQFQFFANIVGTGYFRLTLENSIIDETGDVNVIANQLNSIQILTSSLENGSTVEEDFQLRTDEQLTLFAHGWDVCSNYLGLIPVNWSVNGVVDCNLSATYGVSTTLSCHSTGTIQIESSVNALNASTPFFEVINPPMLAFVEHSFNTNSVIPNSTVDLSFTVQNTGGVGIYLSGSSFLAISDTLNHALQFSISNSPYLQPSETSIVTFISCFIDNEILGGTYTPIFHYSGLDDDNYHLSGDVVLEQNCLEINTLRISGITSQYQTIYPTLPTMFVNVTLENGSETETVNVNTIGLQFFDNQTQQSFAVDYSLLLGDSFIEPGMSEVFTYNVRPANSTMGNGFIIDSFASGVFSTGTITIDQAENSCAIEVVPELEVNLGPSHYPSSITIGQDFNMIVDVIISGDYDFTLTSQESYVSFLGLTANLTDNFNYDSLNPSANNHYSLHFENILTPSNSIGNHLVDISLNGLNMYNVPINFSFESAIEIRLENIPIIEYVDLFPNQVTKGQSIEFEVTLYNNSSAALNISEPRLVLNTDNGTTIYSGAFIFDSYLNNTLTFNNVIINEDDVLHHLELDGYNTTGMAFNISIPFSSSVLNVMQGPNITVLDPDYESIIINFTDNLEIPVYNDGDSDLAVMGRNSSTPSTLELSDGFETVIFELENDTNIPINQVTTLNFVGEIPELIQIGLVEVTLLLQGIDMNGKPYSDHENPVNLIADTIDVPLIQSLRYIDGGFLHIPDGKINYGDLIKVQFNKDIKENILNDLAYSVDATEVFNLTDDRDSFGINEKAQLKSPTAVQATINDSDALYLEITNETQLSLNCASNRDKVDETVIYNMPPSLIVLNPNIAEGLVIGSDDSDTGFETAKVVLFAQYDELLTPNNGQYSKYAVLVEDNNAPIMLNFNYNTNQGNYPRLGLFISGRNFINQNDLAIALENMLLIPNNIVSELVLDSEIIPDYLEENELDNPNLQEFIDFCKEYNNSNVDLASAVLNPCLLFYTSVSGIIEYTYADGVDASSTFDQENNTTLTYSFDIDENTYNCENLCNNTYIKNDEPLGSGSHTLGLRVYDILNSDVGYFNSYNFQVDSIDLHRNEGDYLVYSAPNPFKRESDQIVIEYLLKEDAASVKLYVIDSGGYKVKSFIEGVKQKGLHRLPVRWSGRNSMGNIIAPGVYLLYLSVDGKIQASFVMVAK